MWASHVCVNYEYHYECLALYQHAHIHKYKIDIQACSIFCVHFCIFCWKNTFSTFITNESTLLSLNNIQCLPAHFLCDCCYSNLRLKRLPNSSHFFVHSFFLSRVALFDVTIATVVFNLTRAICLFAVVFKSVFKPYKRLWCQNPNTHTLITRIHLFTYSSFVYILIANFRNIEFRWRNSNADIITKGKKTLDVTLVWWLHKPNGKQKQQ